MDERKWQWLKSQIESQGRAITREEMRHDPYLAARLGPNPWEPGGIEARDVENAYVMRDIRRMQRNHDFPWDK